MIELIKKLSCAFGPSGLEDEVTAIIKDSLSSVCDELGYTKRGTLYGIIKGKTSENRMLISASVDETSFVISDIDDNGFIRVKQLTDFNQGAICGQAVIVGNEDSRQTGIMAAKVLHLAGGAERERPSLDKVFIDVGADSKESVADKFRQGDFVTYFGRVSSFGKNKLCGKALSTRALCAVLINIAINIKQSGFIPENDLILFFNTKSKVGASDLSSGLYKFAPEKVLLLSSAESVFEKEKQSIYLDKGFVLPIKDDGYLYYCTEMFNNARTSGIACQIPNAAVQNELSSRDGYSSYGAKLLRVCLPVCNINTPREIVSLSDIDTIIQLSEKFYRKEI